LLKFVPQILAAVETHIAKQPCAAIQGAWLF
jgi:hypothetical protein